MAPTRRLFEVGTVPRAIAALLTYETAAQQSRAVLYQRLNVVCVDLRKTPKKLSFQST
jgi:hypothetical protein